MPIGNNVNERKVEMTVSSGEVDSLDWRERPATRDCRREERRERILSAAGAVVKQYEID